MVAESSAVGSVPYCEAFSQERRPKMLGGTFKMMTEQSDERYQIANYFRVGLVIILLASGLPIAWLYARNLQGRVGRVGEKPRSGFLYVVDSNNGHPDAQVLLVDPA